MKEKVGRIARSLLWLAVAEIVVMLVAAGLCLLDGSDQYGKALWIVGVAIFVIGTFTVAGNRWSRRNYRYYRAGYGLEDYHRHEPISYTQNDGLLWPSVILGTLTLVIGALLM